MAALGWVDVEQAVAMPGLRVVLSPGVPGPWSESAKAVLHVKKLDYVRVRQEVLGANVALLKWTAQATAPVAAWNDEPPRSTWIEQLHLFERLAPMPRLIPAAFDDRVLMFGLAMEVLGEDGFVANRRHIMVRDFACDPQPPAIQEKFRFLGQKYGYTEALGDTASGRCVEILDRLADRLGEQRANGSPYFIGRSLTALDLYVACAFALVEPLPESLCAMGPLFRSVYHTTDAAVQAAAVPILHEHRDFIYRQHLQLPIDL